MFRNAVPPFDIVGFRISVDASWMLVAVLLIWTLSSGSFPQNMPGLGPHNAIALSVAALAGLFASVVLHEYAHCLISRWFGRRVGNIRLFLFGGVPDPDPEPADVWSEVVIALAGPIASLALAGLVWHAIQADVDAVMSPTLRALMGYLLGFNLALGAVNLIPAFPLDGGRILRAALWARGGDLIKATSTAVQVTTVFAYGLITLGVASLLALARPDGLWLVLMATCLIGATRITPAWPGSPMLLGNRMVQDLMTRAPRTTGPDQTLAEMVETVMLPHACSFLPVVEGDCLLGYVDAGMLKSINRENWIDTHVADIYEPLGPENSLPPDTTAGALLARITATGRRKFLVTDQGRLAGVVCLTDLISCLGMMTNAQSAGASAEQPVTDD